MTSTLTPQSTMHDVLEVFPGARRALFRRYHLGGCSSCGFQPTETLEQLCQRNHDLNVNEVMSHIQASHLEDEKLQISPKDLDSMRKSGNPMNLLDIRTREEWNATHIEGAVLFSQDLMQEILGTWPRNVLFVVYDHSGSASLDAAAYFLGHGFEQVRALRGGIDAWSQEIDPTILRYRLEQIH